MDRRTFIAAGVALTLPAAPDPWAELEDSVRLVKGAAAALAKAKSLSLDPSTFSAVWLRSRSHASGPTLFFGDPPGLGSYVAVSPGEAWEYRRRRNDLCG